MHRAWAPRFAFYTIFSVAPILIIAVAIAGAVFGPDYRANRGALAIAGLDG